MILKTSNFSPMSNKLFVVSRGETAAHKSISSGMWLELSSFNSGTVRKLDEIPLYIAKSICVRFLLASGGKCAGLTVAKTCIQEDLIRSKGWTPLGEQQLHIGVP